jgi:multidrug efflux system membrane fusion protein
MAKAAARRRGVLVGLTVAAIAAGGGFIASRQPAAQQAAPAVPAAIPVAAASVTAQDFPVYLRGLGSVQAFNSVLVRARVDGTLMQFSVTEGQDVKQGDLIAVIDPRPFKAALDQATAKYAQDQADMANAKQDLARYTSLAKQDFASHQQVDTQAALVNHLTAAIAGDEAAIEAAKLNLSFCYILSPFDGRVGLRQVDVGNLVHANDMTGIVTVTQIHPISVTFTLPQTDLPQISDAMAKGKLPVLAYSGDDKTQLDSGELLTVDNMIDASTGTIKLKATFQNTANRLWPGQFVNARLLVTTLPNVLTVPSVAVQHGPNGLYVYLVKPDSTVGRQAVKVAQDNGQAAVIASGLDAGQRVITEGQSRLQAGTLVAVNAETGTGQAATGQGKPAAGSGS